MRASLVVLAAVIAIFNTNANAKAVAPAAEDEANGVDQIRAEQGLQIGPAHNAAADSRNYIGPAHNAAAESRSYRGPDSGNRQPVTKKSGMMIRTESKNFQEHKTRSVSNRVSSRRMEKRDSQENYRSRGVNYPPPDMWFRRRPRPRPGVGAGAQAWAQAIAAADIERFNVPWEFKAKIGPNWPAIDLLKLADISDMLHDSMKGALEKFFSILNRELRNKIDEVDVLPIGNRNTRSACGDTVDGMCYGEFTDDATDGHNTDGLTRSADTGPCSDDGPAVADEDGEETPSRRSDDSPLEYLRETLPTVVRAADTILTDSEEKTWPPDEAIPMRYGGYGGTPPINGFYSNMLSPDYY